MAKLSPQKRKLLDLFSDRAWHCSNEIVPLFIRDYRKRISEMLREGFMIESQVCNGSCGTSHNAGIHMYRLADTPKRPVYEFELVNGVRVPRLTYVEAA